MVFSGRYICICTCSLQQTSVESSRTWQKLIKLVEFGKIQSSINFIKVFILIEFGRSQSSQQNLAKFVYRVFYQDISTITRLVPLHLAILQGILTYRAKIGPLLPILPNVYKNHLFISKLLGCQDPGGLLESSWRPPGGPGRILIFLIVLVVLTGS